MNLPDYFLADLPAAATLSPVMISEACRTLRRNRERYLAHRSTHSLVRVISDVARSWREPDYQFRKLALEQGPGATGFPRATLVRGLDAFFRQLTPEHFHALLEQDLGHAQRLDEMVSGDAEQKTHRASLVTAPEMLVHIAAGNLPSPTLGSMVLGVLGRSAQFVKCASGTTLLPRLFAHSLYEVEPKLGACLEVAEWRGGSEELEKALFDEADCVTATGTDETLAAIRQRLPGKARFVGYGHRVSFAYVSGAALAASGARRIAGQAAADVAAWNQQGCLSPHVIYVEQGGAVLPEQFAEMLAEELERREETEPRGELPVEAAAAIASRRAFYEVRAAHSPDTRQWCSRDSTAWTVIYEADPRFQASCLNRFIYVKSVKDLTEALQSADGVRGRVSTVGLAAPEDMAQALATALARWGVSRVCPLGRMQEPPLAWRHDGRPALGDLVTWTDWEPDRGS
ncbi:MAG TPA: acyl-CoA reductase [Candidatus Paceibacterota bacterium]|nr:acyl-CoA reductase [Verrucomicrobiota bacterium]HSA09510.1 acyl-CoA reductase [Candidatus Paceibacterota bacterium]